MSGQIIYNQLGACRASGNGTLVWRRSAVASIVRTGTGIYEITLAQPVDQDEVVLQVTPICNFSVPVSAQVQFVSETIIRIRTVIYWIAADLDFLFSVEASYSPDAPVSLSAPVPAVAPSPPTTGGKCMMFFGNQVITNTAVTRYLTPGFMANAGTSPIQLAVPFNCTAKNMFVFVGTPAGNGGNITYKLRVNSVGTALLVTIPSTTASGNNVTDTVSLTAGDRIDLECSKAIDVATGPTFPLVSIELDPA